MCGVWGLEVHILDPRLSKGIAKLLHARPFYRARRQIKKYYFAVKRGWGGKCPAANCLDVVGAAAEPAAIAAEAAQVGEFVEMLQTRIKRFESSHRQTRHGSNSATAYQCVGEKLPHYRGRTLGLGSFVGSFVDREFRGQTDLTLWATRT